MLEVINGFLLVYFVLLSTLSASVSILVKPVINGFLLVYFVLLSTLSASVSILVKPIILCLSRPSGEERKVFTQILGLKTEQSKLSIKDEFAAYSKLQRKINTLENQIKENSQSQLSKNLAIKGTVNIGLQVLLGIVILISVILYRREPIVSLHGNLFPFTNILSYPSGVPNAISTHVWVLISNVSIRSIIKPVVS